MAEYGLQASEGVHLGCEHHHEQVGSELGPGYAQNGTKSECLVVPLHLAPSPPGYLPGTLGSGTTSEGSLHQLRLRVLAPHETASSS